MMAFDPAVVEAAVNACEWERDNRAELVTLEAALAAMIAERCGMKKAAFDDKTGRMP